MSALSPTGSAAASAAVASQSCRGCGKMKNLITRCNMCRELFYCSEACRAWAWPKHMLGCEISEEEIHRQLAEDQALQLADGKENSSLKKVQSVSSQLSSLSRRAPDQLPPDGTNS